MLSRMRGIGIGRHLASASVLGRSGHRQFHSRIVGPNGIRLANDQPDQNTNERASQILRPPIGLNFDSNGVPTASPSSSSVGGLPNPMVGGPPVAGGMGDPRMIDCILVRHGESEGNIAYNRSWEGDHSLYTGAFLKRHSSLWRLSDRGREQARIAGEWLRKEIDHLRILDQLQPDQSPIYRYYVSEYIRAMETAALLDIKDAKWFVEVQLRERDWGTFDIMSQKERVVKFSEETRRRDRDSLFYAPPGGESLVHVLSRVDGVLTNFNRQCANRRCIVVCHGEVMWAFRLRFERLSQLTYREMEAASSPWERIHNAQVLWYTRRDPHSGEIQPFFRWKRSVCPWDLTRSSNEWEEISRVEHTNESLTAHVNRVKRIYGHEKSKRAIEREKNLLEEQAAENLLRRGGVGGGGVGKKNVENKNHNTSSSSSSSSTGVANNTTNTNSNHTPPPPPSSSPPSPPPSPLPTSLTHDPTIQAELEGLKRNVPILAAEHPSLFNSSPSSSSSSNQDSSSSSSSSSSTPTKPFIDRSAEELQVRSTIAASSFEPSHTLTSGHGPTPILTPPPANAPQQLTHNFGPTEEQVEPHHVNATSPAASSSSSEKIAPVWRPAPGWPFLSAHPRVLVLTKTPRYEHEKNQSGLKGEHLHAELSKLGFVSDRLVQSYVRHMDGLAQLTQALQQHAMRVTVKHVDSATRADLEGIDLILSAGGDGTMLKAAALLGFQQRTLKHGEEMIPPAAAAAGATGAPLRVAQPAKLAPNSFSTNTNTTISSSSSSSHHPSPYGDSIESSTSSDTIVSSTLTVDSVRPPPTPANNVVGESSSYGTTIDDDQMVEEEDEDEPYVPIPLIGVNTDPQHSSGVLCAFSIEGPHTAERVIEHLRRSHFVWLEKSRIEITLLDKSGHKTLIPQYAYNDVVVAERDPGRPIVYELTVDDHPSEVQRSSGVLVCTGTGSTAWMSNAAAIHPDQVTAVLKDIGAPHKSAADARQIADRINQELVFESNSPEVEYFVREPLLPISSSSVVGRVGYQHRRGWAGRISVRSLGWDAVMSIDGINLVRLPKGTTAVLKIGRRPGASLTVLSLAGTGGQPFSRQ